MSQSFNDKPNKDINPQPTSEVPASASDKPSSLDQNPDQTASPLPDFSTTPPDEEFIDPSLRVSEAGPAELSSMLPAQDPNDSETLGAEADSDSSEDGPSKWQSAWSIIREVGETIILTLIIFFIIQAFVRNFRVVGTSMVNNLHNGQYLIIDKVSYNPYLVEYLGFDGPQRGDVIVFKPPRNPDEDYVKRVIGLPGEKVHVINGKVFINDELLEEPFNPMPGTYTMPAPVVVPEGQVFVLGDNRNNSNDSHNWGPLPVENIVGRAWVSYWPPDQWGAIPRDAPTEEATLRYLVSEFIPNANAQTK